MAEELEEMIRRLHATAETPAEERRTAPRVRRDGVICIHVPGPEGEPQALNVRFRDCSASGVGLTADFPMEVGSHFTITVHHPNKGTLAIAYEVVRCLPNAEQTLFTIGARVLRG